MEITTSLKLEGLLLHVLIQEDGNVNAQARFSLTDADTFKRTLKLGVTHDVELTLEEKQMFSDLFKSILLKHGNELISHANKDLATMRTHPETQKRLNMEG